MLNTLFLFVYGFAVIFLLWQAFRVMLRGFDVAQGLPSRSLKRGGDLESDRTGRLTIHPELLDQDGRITEEELLTVRFSGDVDPPKSAETPAD